MHEDAGLLHEALRTGASGYVVKRAEESEILDAIHTAMRGDIYVYPAMNEACLQQPMYSAQRAGSSGGGELGGLELEVVRLLAAGHTNQRIASGLGISTREVESRRGEIMRKLGLVSRFDLMNYAEEHHIC